MALEGTLKDVGLSDIFQLLQLQQKTGVLTVFRGKEVVTVSFDKGMVVFADEFQRSEQERLGSVLLKAKLVTSQDLLRAVEMQKQTLQKLGFILVNNGFLNQEQLKRALQMQVRETVFKLFRWEDGNFKFSQEPVTFDQGLYQALPSDYLVMEGIRRIDEWPLIKKKIPSLHFIFDRSAEAEGKIGQADEPGEQDLDDILSFVDEGHMDKPVPQGEGKGIKLSSSEKIIFSMVDGRRTVQDLVDEGRIGEFDTCKALYSLLSLGLIKQMGEAAERAAEKAGRDRPVFFKQALGLAAVVVFVILAMLVNPLSVIRVWPDGRAALELAGVLAETQRQDKIKFALLCYYLERKGYPSSLKELVQTGFLASGEILDRQGEEFIYLREQNGFSLRSAAGWTREEK